MQNAEREPTKPNQANTDFTCFSFLFLSCSPGRCRASPRCRNNDIHSHRRNPDNQETTKTAPRFIIIAAASSWPKYLVKHRKTTHQKQSGKTFLTFPFNLEITPTAGNHYFLSKTPSEEPPNTINLTKAQMSIENRGAAYLGCDLESPEISFQKEFRAA